MTMVSVNMGTTIMSDHEHGHHEEEHHDHEHRDHEHHEDEHDQHEHHRGLERHAMEIELHRQELELRKAELELRVLRGEAAARIAKTAENKQVLIIVALQRIADSTDRPEHAAEMFTNLLGRTRDQATRRSIQLQLIETWTKARHPERALEILSQIVAERAKPQRHRPTPRREPHRDQEPRGRKER